MGAIPKLDMEDSYILVTTLRLVQLLLTAITTVITAYLLSNTHPSAPGSVKACVNFIIFACALNWMISGYGLASRYVQSLAVPKIQLPLDATGTIFSLIAALVMSIKLGTVTCSQPGSKSPSWIAAWPKTDTEDIEKFVGAVIGRCRTFQADDAFMYMLAIISGIVLFFTYRSWRKSGGTGGIGAFV